MEIIDDLTRIARRIAEPLLRISLGVVLVWIGVLKFADPTPVVGLLEASLSFLAFAGFVYILGVVEVAGGLLLFMGEVLLLPDVQETADVGRRQPRCLLGQKHRQRLLEVARRQAPQIQDRQYFGHLWATSHVGRQDAGS